jgi:putative YhbY family RNA-binding protein
VTLDNSTKRKLRAKANPLKARINVGRAGVNTAVVEQVRRALAKDELVKVRVQDADKSEMDDIGGQLAEAAECEYVGRTGFVLTFYAGRSENADEA